MKKFTFMIVALLAATMVNAQNYTIVSRSNDTIRLVSNKLGEAVKSVMPGKSSALDNNYRLIEKTWNSQKSLLFIEFTQVVDKYW